MNRLPKGRRIKVAAVWLLASMFLTACGPAMPPAYAHHVNLAHQAVETQRYRDAAQHWANAAVVAKTVNDRHEALFRQASNLRRAGDDAGYWTLLRTLAESPGPRQARAEYELARHDYQNNRTTDADFIRSLLLIRSSAHAARALDLLLANHSLDRRATLLSGLEPRVRDAPELHEYVLWLQAQTAEQRGDAQTALNLYRETSKRYPYPSGKHWDKALLRQALLLSRDNRRRDAIAVLEFMLSHQETAMLFGTYARRYAPARLLWALLLLKDDWQGAHATLLDLAAHDGESLMSDDALWAAAVLAKARSETRMACDDAKRLSTQAADSRYVPCLSTVCSTFESNVSCRPYILERRTDPERLLELMLEPFVKLPNAPTAP